MGKDLLVRARLLEYCASEAIKLKNPTYRDSKIGILKRFFDCLPQDDFDPYLPSKIKHHITQLLYAQETKTLKLWSYRLALYIQSWILDEALSLHKDISDVISQDIISGMKKVLCAYQMRENEIENSLCQAYLSMIYQYLFSININNLMIQSIHKVLRTTSFIKQDELQNLAKTQILKQYKLLIEQESHLEFWQNHVDLGLFNLGGKEVILSKNHSYRVPDGIYEIMHSAHKFKGDFLQLKSLIYKAQCKRLKSFNIGERDLITEKFYKTSIDKLEYQKI